MSDTTPFSLYFIRLFRDCGVEQHNTLNTGNVNVILLSFHFDFSRTTALYIFITNRIILFSFHFNFNFNFFLIFLLLHHSSINQQHVFLLRRIGFFNSQIKIQFLTEKFSVISLLSFFFLAFFFSTSTEEIRLCFDYY
ncbi:hypothetical protein RIF29_07706 [Crotalaria pallida]|uniref:Uncharacterized protein n=1 Tax=Crotalaria pallida TaxID=3830 RepID=A0AAN9PC81_CROPI